MNEAENGAAVALQGALGRGYRANVNVITKALDFIKPGGDRGTRTPNLRDANAALSQLSYIPTNPPCALPKAANSVSH